MKHVKLPYGSHQNGLDQDRQTVCVRCEDIVIEASLRLCGRGRRRGNISVEGRYYWILGGMNSRDEVYE